MTERIDKLLDRAESRFAAGRINSRQYASRVRWIVRAGFTAVDIYFHRIHKYSRV